MKISTYIILLYNSVITVIQIQDIVKLIGLQMKQADGSKCGINIKKWKTNKQTNKHLRSLSQITKQVCETANLV